MMMAITFLREKGAPEKHETELKRYFDLAREFKDHFSRTDCNPYFVGVWDTVSSVGWIENPVRLPYTSNNPDIRIGRHAIAIDERRAFFRSNLWNPDGHRRPRRHAGLVSWRALRRRRRLPRGRERAVEDPARWCWRRPPARDLTDPAGGAGGLPSAAVVVAGSASASGYPRGCRRRDRLLLRASRVGDPSWLESPIARPPA